MMPTRMARAAVALSFALLPSACGGAGYPAAYERQGGDAAESADAEATPEELFEELTALDQHLEGQFAPAAPPAVDDMAEAEAAEMSAPPEPAAGGGVRAERGDPCASSCALGTRICELSSRLCDIADRHPGDDEVVGYCDEGRSRCDRARSRIESRGCGCG